MQYRSRFLYNIIRAHIRTAGHDLIWVFPLHRVGSLQDQAIRLRIEILFLNNGVGVTHALDSRLQFYQLLMWSVHLNISFIILFYGHERSILISIIIPIEKFTLIIFDEFWSSIGNIIFDVGVEHEAAKTSETTFLCILHVHIDHFTISCLSHGILVLLLRFWNDFVRVTFLACASAVFGPTSHSILRLSSIDRVATW